MLPDFTRRLLDWNETHNKREMPWKGEPDPYRIWLSEVILQQTRVEQGRAYYENFVTAFPTVHELAAASEEAVFKLWEGLGYYSRCRNLIATARYVSQELDGRFPSSYDELIKLRGIGPYTAAAIASFAFGEARAVVDGNVIRVLARYFGLAMDGSTGKSKKMYTTLAQALIDPAAAGRYNQAIMDFGATVCKPARPLCDRCVQAVDCEAYRHGFVDRLPLKEAPMARRTRWLYYFIIYVGDGVLIRRREAKDIWQNLYEFALVETSAEVADPGLLLGQLLTGDHQIASMSEVRQQQLTHQRIHGRFMTVRVSDASTFPAGYQLVPTKKLAEFSFPRFITSYLELSEKTM